MKTLTIGYCTTDLVLQVERFAEEDEEVLVNRLVEYPGGSAANVAVGLCRLGLASAFLGGLARDERGLKNLEILDHERVDHSRVIYSPGETASPFAVAVVNPEGCRRLYFHGGAGEDLRPEALTAESLEGIGCVHLCTLGPEFLKRVLLLRKQLGQDLLVSADPGCVGLEGDRVEAVRALMPALDLLFVNEVEFSRLFPRLTPPDISSLKPDTLPRQVVIKEGRMGVHLFSAAEGLLLHQPSFPVKAVDTTGAGDAFAAGYLAGLFLGLPPPRRASFASAVAALSTTRFGCRDGLPTQQVVESFLTAQDGERPAT